MRIFTPRKYSIILFTVFASCFISLGILHAETTHDKISFIVSNSETPPSNNLAWQTTTLPDPWSLEQQQQGTTVWYRIQTFIKSKPTENWSLLLKRLNMNASVFLGQQFIGDGGSSKEPIARNWVRPLLFHIPSAMLQAGENTFYVRIIAYPLRGGGFGSYQLAPSKSLIPAYQNIYFHYITSSELICFTLIVFACLMIFFWLINRQYTEYLWLATASLSGALFPANMFLQNISVSRELWVWAMQVGIGWFVWSILMTFHRYFNISKPKLEKTVAIIAITGTILIFFMPNEMLQPTILLWFSMCVALATYILIVSISEWSKHRDLLRLGWALGYSVMYISAIHDWALIITTRGYFFEIYYHYGTFVLIILACLVMLGRFVQMHKNTQQLNYQLLGKINRFEADEQRRCAVNNERQRIMRDLHDGLGNTLVSAIALSKGGQTKQPELQTTLKNAMKEMRLIVDSQIHTDFNFEKILMLIKDRSDLVLLSSDIEINWDVKALLATTAVQNPDIGLHVIRVLQEALTNAIKHANPSIINIGSTLKGSNLQLYISDNGNGSTLSNQGNGLKNMQSRASEIKGSLSITNNASGTIITLSLPV